MWLPLHWASLVTRLVRKLPSVQEMQVRSPGQEDPLEKEKATHSNILYLENSMDRGAWWATVHGDVNSQTMTD